MRTSFRDFDRACDYEPLERFLHQVMPHQLLSAEKLRAADQQVPHPRLHRRIVAHRAGELVACLWFGHDREAFVEREPAFNIRVLRAHRGQGIGRAQYQRMLDGIAHLDPVSLEGYAFDSEPDGVAFLGRRGFTEVMRFIDLELDVGTFDFDRWDRPGPLPVRSMAEFPGDLEEPALREVHDLFLAMLPDVPNTQEWTLRFEDVRSDARRPDYIHECWLAAEAPDGTFVGTNSLWRTKDPEVAWIGLTGVRRAYRRQGLATALKVHATKWARDSGVRVVSTDNESANEAMLALNRRMGFVETLVEIAFRRSLE